LTLIIPKGRGERKGGRKRTSEGQGSIDTVRLQDNWKPTTAKTRGKTPTGS